MPVTLQKDAVTIARSIVDTCVRHVWDKNDGGFFHEGVVGGGVLAVHDDKKEWWVQAEGARALGKQAAGKPGQAGEYFDRFFRLWTFIDLKLIDHARKGWHQSPSSTRGPKAHMWKDASHEVRALIESIEILKAMK